MIMKALFVSGAMIGAAGTISASAAPLVDCTHWHKTTNGYANSGVTHIFAGDRNEFHMTFGGLEVTPGSVPIGTQDAYAVVNSACGTK